MTCWESMASRGDGENSEAAFNYFAIGAMMNPVSLNARGIVPISSEPAELLDYSIDFFHQGFAHAHPEKGASFHGVIHYLDEKSMQTLDTMEAMYARRSGVAKTYQGKQVRVTVYVSDPSKGGISSERVVPRQRYIDIMCHGCEHYGVKPSYVKFLRSLETQPYPKKSAYLSFGSTCTPDGATATVMTYDEVKTYNGKNGKPLYLTMGDKVIHFDYTGEDQDLFNEMVGYFSNPSLGGQVGDIFMAKMEYDPRYGIPEKLSDISQDYSLLLEHNMCGYLKSRSMLHYFRVVARFDRSAILEARRW